MRARRFEQRCATIAAVNGRAVVELHVGPQVDCQRSPVGRDVPALREPRLRPAVVADLRERLRRSGFWATCRSPSCGSADAIWPTPMRNASASPAASARASGRLRPAAGEHDDSSASAADRRDRWAPAASSASARYIYLLFIGGSSTIHRRSNRWGLTAGGLLHDFDLHCNLLSSCAGRGMRQRDERRFEAPLVTCRQVHVAKL